MKTLEISFSKLKLLLFFNISLFLTIAGVFFIINPEALKFKGGFNNIYLSYTIEIFFIIFFGFTSTINLIKLFSNTPGLLITQEGITDNSSAFTFGQIKWKDIKGIGVTKVKLTKYIVVFVRNPEFYIQRNNNIALQKLAHFYYKTHGSPIIIVSNSLKIKFRDLEILIKTELEKQKNSTAPSNLET